MLAQKVYYRRKQQIDYHELGGKIPFKLVDILEILSSVTIFSVKVMTVTLISELIYLSSIV